MSSKKLDPKDINSEYIGVVIPKWRRLTPKQYAELFYEANADVAEEVYKHDVLMAKRHGTDITKAFPDAKSYYMKSIVVKTKLVKLPNGKTALRTIRPQSIAEFKDIIKVHFSNPELRKSYKCSMTLAEEFPEDWQRFLDLIGEPFDYRRFKCLGAYYEYTCLNGTAIGVDVSNSPKYIIIIAEQ